jgi:protein TonB
LKAGSDRKLAGASFLASFLVHGGLLSALGWYGFGPASAPVVGGGGPGGTEVRIRWVSADPGGGDGASGELAGRPEPEREPERQREPQPEPQPEPQTWAAAAPAAAPEPTPEPQPAIAAAAGLDPGPEADSRGPPAPAVPPGPVPAVADGAGIPEPRYPASCRRLGHEGSAVVRVEVGADGRVGRADVVRSAGCIELDRSAAAALRAARFRPALRFGRPAASVVEQRVRFRLR